MKRIFTTLGTAAVMAIAAAAATPAAFPGGDEAAQAYIKENMQYPSMAMENGVEGVVTVCFTVNPDGSLQSFKIKRPIDPDLESEALRLASGMPKWTPAEENGTPVRSTAEIKISFTL